MSSGDTLVHVVLEYDLKGDVKYRFSSKPDPCGTPNRTEVFDIRFYTINDHELLSSVVKPGRIQTISRPVL